MVLVNNDYIYIYMVVSYHGGTPIAGLVIIGKSDNKRGDLGYPYFRKPIHMSRVFFTSKDLSES